MGKWAHVDVEGQSLAVLPESESRLADRAEGADGVAERIEATEKRARDHPAAIGS